MGRILRQFGPRKTGEEATVHLPKRPAFHKDPFDRMLICQTIQHELTILTPDPLITQYAIRTIW